MLEGANYTTHHTTQLLYFVQISGKIGYRWPWFLMKEAGGFAGLQALVTAVLCGPVVERDLTIGQGSTLERAARTGWLYFRYVKLCAQLPNC